MMPGNPSSEDQPLEIDLYESDDQFLSIIETETPADGEDGTHASSSPRPKQAQHVL